MNPWTALLIGILLGWLIEYAIDWLFWRRKSANEKDVEELRARLQATQNQVVDLEAQLAAAQADYSDLQVETAAKVAEVEEKAAETVEANRPKYDADGFKDSLQGKLAGLGIGAAAVGTALAAGDDSGTNEEQELSGSESAAGDYLDDTAVADDGNDLPEDAPVMEELELIDQEVTALDDAADQEIIEIDDADQLVSEPSVTGQDPDEDGPGAVQEETEGGDGAVSQEEGIELAAQESGDPSEGGEAS
jgi:hypothetical protein